MISADDTTAIQEIGQNEENGDDNYPVKKFIASKATGIFNKALQCAENAMVHQSHINALRLGFSDVLF